MSYLRPGAMAITAALLLASCGTDDTATDSAGSADSCENQEIRVGHAAPSMLYLPFFVALGSGAFEETGLKVVPTDLSGSSTVVTALAAGDLDLAVSSIPPVLAAAREGGRVRAIAALVNNPALYVVAKNDQMAAAGITEDSSFEEKVAFLKDKKIGVTSAGGGADQVARYLLTEGGYDPDKDAQVLAHDSGTTSTASFIANRLDVVVLGTPNVIDAVSEGDATVLWNLARGDLEAVDNQTNVTLVTGTHLLEDQPAVAQCAVDAVADALELLQSDPAAASEAAREYFEDLDPAQYDEGFEDMLNASAESPVISEEHFEKAVSFALIDHEESIEELYELTVDNELAEKAVTGN